MKMFKLFVFPFPQKDHINPLIPILQELLNNEKIEITIFINEEFRQTFESIGARVQILVGFELFDIAELEQNTKKKHSILIHLKKYFLEIAELNLDEISNAIDLGKPDLIFYDALAIHLIWVLEYYKKCYQLRFEPLDNYPYRCERYIFLVYLFFAKILSVINMLYNLKFLSKNRMSSIDQVCHKLCLGRKNLSKISRG